MKPRKDKRNYDRIVLSDRNGVARNRGIHKLLLLVYIGPPHDESLICRHLDGNPQNNDLSNLRWGTNKENSQDTKSHGRQIHGEETRFAKLNDNKVKDIFEKFSTGQNRVELGKEFGIHPNNVKSVLSRKTWTHVEIPIEQIEYAQERLEQESHPRLKKRLSAELVRAFFDRIRQLNYINYQELSKEFDLTHVTVTRLLHGDEKAELRKINEFETSKFRMKPASGVFDEDVALIFQLFSEGITIAKLVKKFNVDKGYIRSILLRKTRANVVIEDSLAERCQKILFERRRKYAKSP